MKKWSWWSSSSPTRMKTHQPIRTWIRTASANPTSGLFDISDQTSRSQITTSSSSHLERSHRDSLRRVRMSSSRGRPPS